MKVDPNELRQRFLKFFDERMKEHARANGSEVKGSLILPSSSLQPPDASTLFTSAGMHQFKDDFTGNLVHGTRAAATVQKCMRTPDLENVGKTARHHTFFEMMGFFSFGDGLKGPNGSVGFFKKEAIRWIWDFYTLPWAQGGCELDTKKLYVSVYGGDETGKDRDDEAANIWREILGKVWPKAEVEKRIFFLGEHDNFWPAGAPSQGPNGVCGPCSEMFYDCGPEYGEGDVATNGARFMEIGNIVFTQYERSGPTPGKGTLTPLPAKNIDFGGGFERLVMVKEGVKATLDTSLFEPIRFEMRHIAIRHAPAAASMRQTRYQEAIFHQVYAGGSPKDRNVETERIKQADARLSEDGRIREKRIADHIRAVVFAMADGILPSNESAGYVLRRIIRRAYRDGAALGASGPFLHELLNVVTLRYGAAYPEVKRNAEAVTSIVKQEEQQFSNTLARGLELLSDRMAFLRRHGEKVFEGKVAFDLYQSQGLPREVVQDELAAEGLMLDQAGYDAAEEEHRERSKGGKQVVVFEKGWFQDLKGRAKPTEFLGYETCEAPGKVLAIVRDNQPFDIIEAGDSATIVLDRTPFYGESGGQVGDRGSLQVEAATQDPKTQNPKPETAVDGLFEVADTKKRDDYFLHQGKLLHGKLRVGDTVTARVDQARRDKVRANHSATHLMHAALRKVLGEHVVQRGSEVGPDRLRFDFSHPKGVTFDERQQIEKLVNEQVQANAQVGTAIMSPEDAQKAGAMALFGEKYGDKVRVLSMGTEGFSKELCGGTHVARTGDIGYFRIVSEGSSSSGVRRIEAVTGQAAYDLAAEEAKLLANLHALTKAQPGKVMEKVEGLIKEVKDLKSKSKKGVDSGALDNLRKQAETLGDASLVVADMQDAPADDLLTIVETLRQDAKPLAVLLGSRVEGRAILLLAFSKELTGRGLHAGKIVGEIARLVDGGGGGKPDIAQAGGKKPEALPEALEKGRSKLKELMNKAS